MNRETKIQNEILKLGAPGGKLRVLSPNEKRICIGDVLAQTKGSIANPRNLLAVLRPLQKPTSDEELLAEARKLDGFEVFAPGEIEPLPEDVLLFIQGQLAYPDKPAAILRLK